MFSHAAFSAASGRPRPVDLKLSGTNRPRPVIVGEETEAPSAPIPDLAASSAPSALGVLPPAASLTAEQEDFRRQSFDEVRMAFEAGEALGTVRAYEANFRGIAPEAALKLGSPVLPMVSRAQFLPVFGAVLILGPKSPPPVSGLPGVLCWSRRQWPTVTWPGASGLSSMPNGLRAWGSSGPGLRENAYALRPRRRPCCFRTRANCAVKLRPASLA